MKAFWMSKHQLRVVREEGDPAIRSSSRPGMDTDPDSAFLFALQKVLRDMGHDVVKRRLSADGHMLGFEGMQYLRERHWDFGVYHGNYALYTAVSEYNKTGAVTLQVEHWEGGELDA